MPPGLSHIGSRGAPAKAKFSATVRAIIAELGQIPNQPQAIAILHRRHQINRRRLYDVINIFTTIGCATRTDSDHITWHGVHGVLEWLIAEKRARGIANPQLSLLQLFPQENSVGLASLASSLLLIFPAIRQEILNLRDVSGFFARDTQRYKTTLCKLYQITLILGALEVTERAENPCEVRIRAPFAKVIDVDADENPLAIEWLLNRATRSADISDARRAEFRSVCDAHEGIRGGGLWRTATENSQEDVFQK
jgi:hypothetical protein